MTPLERLKELNEKATPGPWDVFRGYRGVLPGIEADGQSVVLYSTEGEEDGSGVHGRSGEEALENARLIAHMRNLLPELLALWEASDKWFWKDAAYPGADTQAIAEATSALNARAEEIMK